MTKGALAYLAAATVLCAAVPVRAPAAMGASLVRDIAVNRGSEWSSFPHGFHRLGGWTLFFAQTPAAGNELWRTDGTAAGTRLVKDLEPGPFGSDVSCFAERDGAVYFLAPAAKADDFDPDEAVLWRSDGTPQGTVSLARVAGEVREDIPCPIVATAGRVMFAVVHAEGDGYALDVWRSNGTAAGTDRVARIASAEPSYPTLVAAGRTVFFDAASAAGVELWKSDGTAAGTRLVTDIAPGAASAYPLPIGGVGDTLLFAVPVEGAESTLWRSDGTAAGTTRVVERTFEINAFTPRLVVGDRLLFSAPGEGIVSTDGTADGTVTTVPGTTAAAFARLGESVLFINARLDGSTLWRWDDLDGAPSPVAELGVFQLQIAALDTQILFTIAAGSDIELWRTDGSAAGTARLNAPGLTYVAALGAGGRQGFFSGSADGGATFELWSSDGTSAGTGLLADLVPADATTASSSPRELVEAGGRLYFIAIGSDLGPQLWTSDGTAVGTTLVREIGREGYLQSLSELTPYRGALFFAVSRPTAIGPTGLWRSDGTVSGTAPTQPSWQGAIVSRLTVAGDHLYFLDASALPLRVCRSDGDRDDVRCAGSFRTVREMVAFGDRVLLSADGPTTGVEPWISDGTAQGTSLIKDIAAAPGMGSEPHYLQTVGDGAFFVTASGSGGSVLWRTDGTGAGTEQLYEWPAAAGGAPVEQAVAGGANLFLVVAQVEGGSALWVSNGRSGGTQLVRHFDPTTDPGDGMLLAPFGDRVLMSVDDGEHGTELWVSDGSGAGTRLLRDLRPGPRGSSPTFFSSLDRRVAFTARTDLGFEPWVTDGTPAGTVMIADVAPGVAPSNPTAFAELNGTIYFSATDLIHGYELWRGGPAPACRGDCRGDGQVTIDDLIQAVGIALGSRPVGDCSAVDAGGDGRVTIDELVAAVGAALVGC